MLKALREDHGRIADRVHTGCNRTVDLSECYFVAEQNSGFQTRSAGALQIEARRFRGEPGARRVSGPRSARAPAQLQALGCPAALGIMTILDGRER